MNHFSNKWWKLLVILAVALIFPYSAIAQLSLVSSSPADGQTGVATTTNLQLVFSAALDTSFVFESRNNNNGGDNGQGGKDDLAFLKIEIFPKDSLGKPDHIEVSADLKTVTAVGVTLAPHTKYIFFLSGAKALNGADLDRPYVITFTADSAFPAGAVTGEVTFPGNNPAGAVVALMSKNFEDDLNGLAVVNSPYQVQHVADGTYYPLSLKELNGDGELDFGNGDALGFYDPNQDNIIDSVVVANGATLQNINIQLELPEPQTARTPYPDVESVAQTWAQDAGLVIVNSDEISASGTGYSWQYLFYSKIKNTFKMFMSIGSGIIPMDLRFDDHGDQNGEPQLPDTTALPPGWLDSDDVALIAEANGGSDFRTDFPEARIYANLGNSKNNGPGNDNGSGAKTGRDLFKARKEAFLSQLALNTATEEPVAVWFFHYQAENWNDYFEIAINAETGEVLHSSKPNTARESFAIASAEAGKWANDAQLIYVETHGISANGTSSYWRIEHYSPAKNATFIVETYGASFNSYEQPGNNHSWAAPLPENWIDSPQASAVAEANSDDFRNRFPDSWVQAWLDNDHYNNDIAIWWFEYQANNGQERLKIGIDAVTGEFLQASGPLKLESSSPADGAVNVPNTTDFTFTFSAPVDTFQWYGDRKFIEFEIFPIGLAGEPTSVEVSADLKTVTLAGIPLTDNTRFIGLLTGARSADGQYLETAYVINFTTGNSLPQASIAGEVSFAEEERNANDVLVLLFKDGVFPSNLVGMAVANSPYELKYVADGTYLPVAIDPNTYNGGPFVGYPDPDHNGVPDSVTVSNGQSVNGVNIALRTPPRQTARQPFAVVERTAANWAADARLVALAADFVDNQGKSFEWVYVFYSKSRDEFGAYGALGNIVLFAEPTMGYMDTTAVPANWIDSDDAAAVAEENGGHDFRQRYPESYVFAYLEAREVWVDPNAPVQVNFEAGNLSFMKNKKWQLSNEVQKSLDYAIQAVWVFSYFTPSTYESMEVIIDALTGEVLLVRKSFTAREGFARAGTEATNHVADAKLINVGSPHFINLDGKAHEWRYTFYAASLDTLFSVVVYNDMSAYVEPLYFGMSPPSMQALPEQWIDSRDAMTVAESHSDYYRNRHYDTYVEAFLSRGLFFDDSRAVWQVKYSSYSQGDSLVLHIDGQTAALLTSVVDNAAGNLPKTFALQQNYPNPFNPQTTIEYQLPKASFVELEIFNLVGQKVRSLIQGEQSPGYYKITWDGKNDIGVPATSGMYVFRLKTKEFTRTKKMIFLK